MINPSTTAKSKVMKRLSILILDGESGLSLPVRLCLNQIHPIDVHVMTKVLPGRRRLAFALKPKRQQVQGAVANEEEKALLCIQKAVKQYEVDIILATDEAGIRFLAAHRQSLSGLADFVAPPLGAFDVASNKWRLAKFMAKAEIPSPQTLLCSSGSEFEAALRAIPFPVLLKPVHGLGGKAIRCFEQPQQVIHFLSKEVNSPQGYIVQRYIKGYDIDCSVLCQNGDVLAHTIQRDLDPQHGNFSPARELEFVNCPPVLDVVSNLMKHLRWSGVAHVDLRFDEEQGTFHVIEVNPRYWASLVASAHAGINFPWLACQLAQGQRVLSSKYRFITFATVSTVLKKKMFGYLGRNNRLYSFRNSLLTYVVNNPVVIAFSLLKWYWDLVYAEL